MKQSEAATHVHQLLIATLKFRSNAVEAEGTTPDAQWLLDHIHPWIFGSKSLLPSVERMEAIAEQTGTVAPLAFYNMMVIVAKWAPALNAQALLLHMLPFPEPDPQWLHGWESE